MMVLIKFIIIVIIRTHVMDKITGLILNNLSREGGEHGKISETKKPLCDHLFNQPCDRETSLLK